MLIPRYRNETKIMVLSNPYCIVMHVLVSMDNTTVIAYINQQGGPNECGRD